MTNDTAEHCAAPWALTIPGMRKMVSDELPGTLRDSIRRDGYL